MGELNGSQLSAAKIIITKSKTATDSILIVIQVEDSLSTWFSSSVPFYFSSPSETLESSLLWRNVWIVFTEPSIDKLTSVTCSAKTLLG